MRCKRFCICSILFLCNLFILTGQEYDFRGFLRFEGGGKWYNDTFAEYQYLAGLDRLIPFSRFRGEAYHRFHTSAADAVLKHDISVVPLSGADNPVVGEVGITTRLYEGYIAVAPAPRIEVVAGRQCIDWGAGTFFSAGDALHPRFDFAETDVPSSGVGFDGLSLRFAGDSGYSLSLSVALQEVMTESDFREIRAALYSIGSLSLLEIGASFVYQWEEILRPGVLLSYSPGAFTLSGETALEMYGTEATIEPRILANAAVEYRFSNGALDATATGEYLANGLADPFLPDSGRTRLNDNAGGFSMNDLQYARIALRFLMDRGWNTEHSALINLLDGSAFMNHRVILTSITGVDLGSEIIWTGGAGTTEFGFGSYDNPFHVIGTFWVDVEL